MTNDGWKTPKPNTALGEGGIGAVEILARYSISWTDQELFRQQPTDGFDLSSSSLLVDDEESVSGATNQISAAILDGAHMSHEATIGINWNVNSMVRVQLNDVFLWVPSSDRNGDGENDNFLISGVKSDRSDPSLKKVKIRWENAVMGRLIFKI